MRRYLTLLVTIYVSQFVHAQSNYCGYASAHRDPDSICRTRSDGGQYCEYDPYGRVCAYVTVLNNGVDETLCTTCVDGSPVPPNDGSGTQHAYNYQDCGFYYGDYTGCDSPIVLNPEDGAITLSGSDNPVRFDLNADGLVEFTTWTAPGSAVAFLALDRNGNGIIDDGSELFGNHTPGVGGVVAENGFEALAALDTNHDGVLDAADPGWASLLLWTDRNHDGRSDPSELRHIASSSVTALTLDYRLVGRRDEYGNYFRYEGGAQLEHGSRRIYDVFFRVANP